MVAPIIGAALMRAGGAIAGKSAARSAAGSILSSGGSNKILEDLTKILNKNVEKIIHTINKNT